MDTGKNRLWITLGSLGAIGLLLTAFVVVWLSSRGPESGQASTQNSSQTQAAKSNSSSSSNQNYSQVGAPSMAPVTDQPHISVHGTGSISAKPDIVNLQVGVQIQKTLLEDAQSEAANKMDAVINQLKSSGVDEKDIATAQYNVEPVMDYRENQAPTVTGFRVTNIVNAKVRDISKAGKLIDDMVKSGANTIYGVSFGFSDPTALMRQAREQAMQDAKAKADQFATLSGVALGSPLVIDDGGSNTPPVPVQALADTSFAAGKAAPTSINPGQQEIRVDVSVVYGIK